VAQAVWQFHAQIVADFEQRDLDAAVSTMMAMLNHGATYLEKPSVTGNLIR